MGQSEMELEVNTLGDVIESLISRDNSAKELFFDAHGKLRSYITFYINNMAKNPPDLSQKLNDKDLVILVPTAAGG
jgi:molybdopterin converting factor small subunit